MDEIRMDEIAKCVSALVNDESELYYWSKENQMVTPGIYFYDSEDPDGKEYREVNQYFGPIPLDDLGNYDWYSDNRYNDEIMDLNYKELIEHATYTAMKADARVLPYDMLTPETPSGNYISSVEAARRCPKRISHDDRLNDIYNRMFSIICKSDGSIIEVIKTFDETLHILSNHRVYEMENLEDELKDTSLYSLLLSMEPEFCVREPYYYIEKGPTYISYTSEEALMKIHRHTADILSELMDAYDKDDECVESILTKNNNFGEALWYNLKKFKDLQKCVGGTSKDSE